MKYVKRFLVFVFVLVLLLVAALFVLTNFYKKEIADALISDLKARYGLAMQVGDVDVSLFSHFPQASVSLKEVLLDNDLHHDSLPLLKAGTITVSFSLRKLLDRKFEINAVSVKDAALNLVASADGSKNFEFKKQDSAAAKSAKLELEIQKLSIQNTRFDFRNEGRGQHMALLLEDELVKFSKHPEGFDFVLGGDVKIGGLLFHAGKGAFLKDAATHLEFEGTVFTGTKSCFIRPSSQAEINRQSYALSAFIVLGEEKQLLLKAGTKALPYAKAIRLVNPKIAKVLSNFVVEKPLDAELLLFTRLGMRQEPVIVVRVGSTHNHITIGNTKVPYEDVSFKGLVLSLDSARDKGNAEEAIVKFSAVKGRVYDVPFTASVKLRNFTQPDVFIDARLLIDARKVKLKTSDEFDLRGTCLAHVSYTGPASKINKQEFLESGTRLRADLVFRNFSYKEKHKPYVYTINGQAVVDHTDLAFSRLVLGTNGGEVTLNGKAQQFTPYALGFGNSLSINLEAYSSQFDLNPFLKASAPSKDSNATASQAKAVKQMQEESVFDFNVSLRAARMLIRKVVAEDVRLNLAYKNKLLSLRSVNMNACGGKLSVRGTISNLQHVETTIHVDDIDVNTLFEQFENFGQQAIQSKHLRGRISLDAAFSADLDGQIAIVPSTMAGDVSLELKDGHLVEYEPMQNISSFIFHNRDFNDIRFSEINERFRVKGYEMQIEELEIASNVLNLFVSGTYNFKSQSNINLVIPWSNLKKRGRNYIPKSSGLSADETKGLKLNFSGEPKKMKLSLGHK